METNIDYKKRCEEKEAELKKAKKELKDVRDNSNIKITKYYKDSQINNKTINDLKIELKNMEDIILEKGKLIIEKDLKIKEISTIEQNFKKIIANNKELRKKVENQHAEIVGLKKKNNKIKITNDTQINTAKVNERESNLLKEISGLKKKNNTSKELIDKLLLERDVLLNSKKIGNTIYKTIEILHQNLNFNNVDSYKNIETLLEKVNILLENKDNCEFVNKDIITKNENIQPDENILWGYTFEENNELKFIDIDGKYYPIESWGNNNIKVDMPVKAILTDTSSIVVEKVYNECNHGVFNDPKKSRKKKSTQIQNENDDEKIIPIGNYKVMIITGRSFKHYKEYLEQYGLKVSVFDPYEENLNLLSERVESQDIVFVMRNAIPHTVTDIVDKNDVKVQVMGRDNKKYLVARLKYFLANNIESTDLTVSNL